MKYLIIVVLLVILALPTFASETSGILTAQVISENTSISVLQEMINQLSLLVEKLQLILNNYV